MYALDRAQIEQKVALACQRVTNGERMISSTVVLVAKQERGGLATAGTETLLSLMRDAQKAYVHERDRYLAILTGLSVAPGKRKAAKPIRARPGASRLPGR